MRGEKEDECGRDVHKDDITRDEGKKGSENINNRVF